MLRNSQTSSGELHRGAFTLMEVMAALTLTALLAAIASRQFRFEAQNVLQAEQVAETIRLELASVRQMAILKSEPHGLAFVKSKGRISGIERFRRDNSGKRIRLDTAYTVPESLNEFSVNRSSVEFDSEGAASGATRLSLGTERRKWAIDIYAVTGMVRVTLK